MKLVILDRDGTINSDSDEYVKSPEEWMPLPGALEAIARQVISGHYLLPESPLSAYLLVCYCYGLAAKQKR